MFHDGGICMGGMHALWWLFWLGLIAIIVFYGWRRPGKGWGQPCETPHDILQRRLASGEISPDEYERRKSLLDRDRGGRP